MFSKREVEQTGKVDTVIGKGTAIKGSIESQGVLRIDGQVEGEVQNKGDVIIGEGAQVTANIIGRNVVVAGQINGNVDVEGTLEILKTGRLHGDIKAAQLVIAPGAIFQGSSQMRVDEAPKAKGKG